MTKQFREWQFSCFITLALGVSGVLVASDTPEPLLVSFSGGATFENFSLGGSGFNAQLPQSTGLVYGVHGSRGVGKNWSVWGKLNKQDTVFRDIVGVTPTSLNLTQWQMSFGVCHDLGLEGWGSGLQLLLGYGVQANRAQTTSPNAVIASNVSFGPSLGAAWKQPMGNYRLFAQIDFFLPNWFREDGGVTTGSYLSAYRVTWQMEAGMPITPSLWIYAGLHLGFEKQNFTGTGTRGVTDGSQSLFNVILPLRLEVQFE